MKTIVTFEIDTDNLSGYIDSYLATLWHIAQANPAPFGDNDACQLAEHIGRECIKRFVERAGVDLWSVQGRHIEQEMGFRMVDPPLVGDGSGDHQDSEAPGQGLRDTLAALSRPDPGQS